MNRWERWGLWVGSLATAVTGLVYGYLRYFAQVNTEFGVEPHPWQGPLQHAHVLVAPGLVFALGFAGRGHVYGMLRHHVTHGRKTGLILLGGMVPMIFGGYLIQVVTSPSWRLGFAWTHGIASMLFVVAFTIHWLKPSPKRQRARAELGRLQADRERVHG